MNARGRVSALGQARRGGIDRGSTPSGRADDGERDGGTALGASQGHGFSFIKRLSVRVMARAPGSFAVSGVGFALQRSTNTGDAEGGSHHHVLILTLVISLRVLGLTSARFRRAAPHPKWS